MLRDPGYQQAAKYVGKVACEQKASAAAADEFLAIGRDKDF
jgi:hypothetical protein